MRETWYVLEDGTVGDPREVVADEAGVLRHKDGKAVAYGPHGPRSRGVDVEAERESSKTKSEKEEAKDVKPEKPKRGYKTRESKAD